jgi:hypothetical protein
MTSTTLAIQLEQLRALRLLIEVVPAGARHDDLIKRARIAVATVRKTRDALARTRAAASHPTASA